MDFFGGKKEFSRLEDVWNKRQKKFIIQIVEARDLAAKDMDGLSDPYVKIIFGEGKKNELRTAVYKDTLNPKFNEKELFRIEPGGHEIKIEMWDKDIAFDDFLGCTTLGKIEGKVHPETIVDTWLDLESRKGKNDKVHGQLRVRYFYSLLKETRPPAEIFADNKRFTYDSVVSRMKTGDLIAFDSVGFLHTLIKVTSNSPYSHLGIVVRLPNKYTKKEELYLVELTNNLEGFLDAKKEVASDGVCIFRLFERIHQFNCTRAWYFSLKQPLTKEEEEKFREHLLKCHSGSIPLDPRWTPPIQITNFINNIDKSLTKKGDYRELYGSQFICDTFKSIGKPLVRETPVTVLTKPADILEGDDSKFDQHPVLLVNMKTPEEMKADEEKAKEGQEVLEEKEQQEVQFVAPALQQMPMPQYPPSVSMVPRQQVHVCPACGTQSVESIMVPQFGGPPTQMMPPTQLGFPPTGTTMPQLPQVGTLTPLQSQQFAQQQQQQQQPLTQLQQQPPSQSPSQDHH